MIFLEITVACMLVAQIMAWFYIRGVDYDAEQAEKAIRALSAELEQVKAKQRVFEKRFMKMTEPAEKVIISHEYHVKDAPHFPNSEGFS